MAINKAEYKLDWSRQDTKYRWTLNNYSETDKGWLRTLETHPNHKYTVYGVETGENGTPHLQGFTIFQRKLRPKPAMQILQDPKAKSTIFVFHCDYTNTANIAYCKKQNDWQEIGSYQTKSSGGGKVMSDRWSTFKKAIRDGATDEELCDLDFNLFSRSLRLVDRLRLQFKPVRTSPCRIILLCGDTGVGKTKWVNDKYPGHVRVPMLTDKKFWLDGWQSTDKVLFWDEFCGQIPLASLLELTDPWYNVLKVPNKGSHVWFVPDLIIFASNMHPSDWYSYTGREHQREALKRRFHEHGTIYVNNLRILPVAFWNYEKVYSTKWSEYEEKCIDPSDDEVNAALAFYNTPQDDLAESSEEVY